MTTPPDGTVYLASDNRWYRWPDPTPYPSREAAALAHWSRPYTAAPVAHEPFYAPPAPSSGVLKAVGYVGAVVIGLPILVGLIGVLVLPDHHTDGGCDGIGFGCTPAPSSAAFFLAALSLVVTVPATAFAWLMMRVFEGSSATFREWPPILKAGSVVAGYAVVGLLLLLAR